MFIKLTFRTVSKNASLWFRGTITDPFRGKYRGGGADPALQIVCYCVCRVRSLDTSLRVGTMAMATNMLSKIKKRPFLVAGGLAGCGLVYLVSGRQQLESCMRRDN